MHDYGYLIHEFDPWFNFRVAQYLAKNGWFKFAKWCPMAGSNLRARSLVILLEV